MSIVVFGSINMDLTTYAPRLPALGETLFGYRFLTVPGGKGANQAVAAARLGARTRMFGRVGDDAFGRAVLPQLEAQGLDIGGVVVDPQHDTALAVISVDDNADNAIIVISGVNMKLDESDVARCLPALDDARVLMLQIEAPLAASLKVAQEAKARGVQVVFDPAPARELPAESYALFDCITPNEVETETLTGLRPANAAEAARAAAILRERGARTAIIKLGGAGVYFEGPEGSGFIPPFAVNAVDTVAAGDAFNGGLAVALAEGLPIAEAVRWGAAAGALATTKPGAMPSMPYRDELETLLKEGKPR